MSYGLKRTALPASEPVTLADIKAHCRIEVSTDDALVAALISAAREYIERRTGMAMVTQTWVMTFDDWPEDEIELPVYPVQSISSITYVDTDGATQTLSGSIYQLDATGDPATVSLAYGQTWPPARDQEASITLTFVAGYTGSGANVMPDGLKHAIRMLVGHWYENRETAIVGTTAAEMPMAVEALIAPYRRIWGFC